MIFSVDDPVLFKRKALNWAAASDVCCYLDSNGFTDAYSKFDALIAVGAKRELLSITGNAFGRLDQFKKANLGWLFGFFAYDLKNEIEQLSSKNAERLNFPDLYFFVPLHLVIIKGDKIEIISDEPGMIQQLIEGQSSEMSSFKNDFKIRSRLNKSAYIHTVEKIKEHINRGDIYVTNFCQEFYADNAVINPVRIFTDLNTISPTPFASFFRYKDNYILCATPERFLAKRAGKLISQPIKGTAKRGKTPEEDKAIKQQLRLDTKELQENVMVVDMVRNDLTRSAKPGTVKTDELFGIYSFKQVHQMISTVSCTMDEDITTVQAIKNSFPMGSMTGAPKVSAMQLMDEYEVSRRGLYSGALGYFSPDENFDFNVVIRSVLYNAANRYLSFSTGSAITYHADAEKEYEECLLKASAILEALGVANFNL